MVTSRTADRISRIGFELSDIASRLREAGLSDQANTLLAASDEVHHAALGVANRMAEKPQLKRR